ncbi:hypothetical protein [Streptomyces eurythermus]
MLEPDPLREVHVPPAWPYAAAFLREAVDWFALDRTEGQRPVYVAAEKDTLRQMFTTWLAEYGIPVLVVRGFASQSYADVVRSRTARHGRAPPCSGVAISTPAGQGSNGTGSGAPRAAGAKSAGSC